MRGGGGRKRDFEGVRGRERQTRKKTINTPRAKRSRRFRVGPLCYSVSHKQNGDIGKTENNLHITASEYSSRISIRVRYCYHSSKAAAKHVEMDSFTLLLFAVVQRRRQADLELDCLLLHNRIRLLFRLKPIKFYQLSWNIHRFDTHESTAGRCKHCEDLGR